MNYPESITGVRVTSVTLVGYIVKSYPAPGGNCFSMKCNDGKERRIVNFNYENLQHCIANGVTLPIRIIPLSDRIAAVADPRIPRNYYDKTWCTTCCPESLLPIPQRIDLDIQRLTGERVETEAGEFRMVRNDSSKKVTFPGEDPAPKIGLKGNWKFEEGKFIELPQKKDAKIRPTPGVDTTISDTSNPATE